MNKNATLEIFILAHKSNMSALQRQLTSKSCQQFKSLHFLQNSEIMLNDPADPLVANLDQYEHE